MRLSTTQLIADILLNDGVVILPTDTVYGLFCMAKSRKATAAIYKIKGRSKRKPLQLFLPDKKMISQYAVVDKAAKIKINKMLPGPYTLILKLKPELKSAFVFLKSGTAGFRVVNSNLLNSIMKIVKGPLAATSANVSGDITPKKYDEINDKIIASTALSVIDDKKVTGRSSTVIDLTGSIEKVIRV